MYSHYAFVSESGNYGLEFDEENITKWFVVTAVLVESQHIEAVQQQVEEICSKYFQAGEIKASELGTDKRFSMINELVNIDFHIYSIAVNKKRLRMDGGFGYEKSFIKYVNGLLYSDLFKAYTHMQIYAEDTRGPDFMKEFETYINERHTPDLFDRSLFEFASRSDNALIQLSDFIGDTIFRKFESAQGVYDDLLKELSDKVIRIETWPTYDFNIGSDGLEEMGRQYDQVIAEQAIQAAERYINENENSPVQVIKDRIIFLKFLRTQLTINRNEYIYSQEIIENVKKFSPEAIHREYLMGDIIGPLRDAGLLISSTSKGYKIPTTMKDLIEYADFSSSRIMPMLRRLERARDKILMITNNELDILAGEKFEEIKEFFDVKYGRV